MLQNAYFLAEIGADTAENEQHFAEILPTDPLWRLRRLDLLAQCSRRAAGFGRAKLRALKERILDVGNEGEKFRNGAVDESITMDDP